MRRRAIQIAESQLTKRQRQWSIILGCPRSGTTFLVGALAGADYTSAVSGRVYPSQIPAIWNADLRPDVCQAIRSSMAFTLEDYLQEAEGSRTAAISAFLQQTIGVGELVAGVRRQRILHGMVYKENLLAFAPDLPYEALPNSRIVHIYRDGRDAADSLLRKFDPLSDLALTNLGSNVLTFARSWDDRYVPWWVEKGRDAEFIEASPFVRSVWLWKVLVRRSIDFARKPDVAANGRVLEICYETLVTNPVEEGRRVLDHFGIRTNRRMEKRFRQAHDRSVGVHRRRDPVEIERATTLAQDELVTLGYDL